MRKTLFLFAITLCTASTMLAQGWFLNHPVSATMGNQSISTPFYKTLGKPFNPSLILSTEWEYGEEESKGNFFQTINLGGFLAKYSQQAVHLSTSFGYRFRMSNGFFTDIAIEGGLQQTFHKEAIFEQSGNGYEQVTDFGKTFGIIGGQLSMGYNVGTNTNRPFDVYVQYRLAAMVPYPDLIVLPQEFLSIGTRFHLFK